jgi:hypothetical protein
MTPRQIVTLAGGHKAVCDAVGLKTAYTRDSVNQHIKTGKLPAAWFDALERKCKRKLPRTAFSFKYGDTAR